MGNIYNRNHQKRRRRMRRSQKHSPVNVKRKVIASNGLSFVTFSLIGFSRFDWYVFNKCMEWPHTLRDYPTAYPDIDIKNFINKWSGFEEANWMGPDLKIGPAFKALSVGIRRYYYFICFPESASVDVWYCKLMDSTTVSGIRNQPVEKMYV